MKKRSAYRKDMVRSIWRSRKRFLSILAITALGVTVLTGIYAACQDMYYSADRFYDDQRLFDIRVLSTMGLTQEDVESLRGIEGIELAEGAYGERVHTQIKGMTYTAVMNMLSEKGLNLPYVMEGSLPSGQGEIGITPDYARDADKGVGDTLSIEEVMEEEEIPNFISTEYRITAIVTDPMDISNNDASFRSGTAEADYTFFLSKADVDTEVYSSVYVTLTGLRELDCYSEEYEGVVREVIHQIEEEIKEQREKARRRSILEEAKEEIEEAEDLMNEEFTEAKEKLTDAWQELADGEEELAHGERKLIREEQDALQKIADARREIEEGKEEIASAQAELADGVRELDLAKSDLIRGEQELNQGQEKLNEEYENAAIQFASVEKELEEKQAWLNQGRKELEGAVSQLKAVFGEYWPETEWNALVRGAAGKAGELMKENPGGEPDPNAVAGAVSAEQAALGTALGTILGMGNPEGIDAAQITSECIQAAIGLGILEAGQQAFDAGKGRYEGEKAKALQMLKDAEWEINNGLLQIEEGWNEIRAAEEELEKGKREIEEALQELLEGEEELNREEAKAKKEIGDAWREIEEGKAELLKGEEELIKNQEEYEEKREEAEEKVADAYRELGDIDMVQWYVQDRSALSSYSSLKSDMSSIEAVGAAFPILFLIVAVLISLTTMTRMVEEERGLIGTYKALGFGNGAIYLKYLIYAALACVLGGILGDVGGFILLPKFLLYVLQKLYVLPYVELRFNIPYGVGGVLLFMGGILLATLMVCRKELKETPSVLMRPRLPGTDQEWCWNRFPFYGIV